MERVFVVCAVFLMGMSSSVVMASATGEKKQAVQKVYNSISKALAKKDIETVMATYTDDYQAIKRDGSIEQEGKDAERERLQRVFANSSSVVDKTLIQSATPIGADLAVVVKRDYTRTQYPEQGLVGSFHQEGTYREFWVHSGDKWLLKRSRGLLITTTKLVNGKPIH